jgi:hypothetical protein
VSPLTHALIALALFLLASALMGELFLGATRAKKRKVRS